MDKKKINVRDRIIEIRKMPLGDVAINPDNTKTHPQRQRETLHSVVNENGWYSVPIAYYSEKLGGKLVWADGNLRGDEFASLEANVAITDLNDREAKYAILTMDPLAAMIEQNREKLDAALQEIKSVSPAVHAMLAETAEKAGLIPPGLEFKEYDESVEGDVEYITCPECGHKWPK